MTKIKMNDAPIILSILITALVFTIIIYVLNYTIHNVSSLVVRVFTYLNSGYAMSSTCKTTYKILNKYLNEDNYYVLVFSVTLVGILVFLTVIILAII